MPGAASRAPEAQAGPSPRSDDPFRTRGVGALSLSCSILRTRVYLKWPLGPCTLGQENG